jgi:hypothetical protein
LGDWKLVYHYHKIGEERYELFNLEDDLDESYNRASSDPKRLQLMVRSMGKALEEADAQYVTSMEDPSQVLRPE